MSTVRNMPESVWMLQGGDQRRLSDDLKHTMLPCSKKEESVLLVPLVMFVRLVHSPGAISTMRNLKRWIYDLQSRNAAPNVTPRKGKELLVQYRYFVFADP